MSLWMGNQYIFVSIMKRVCGPLLGPSKGKSWGLWGKWLWRKWCPLDRACAGVLVSRGQLPAETMSESVITGAFLTGWEMPGPTCGVLSSWRLFLSPGRKKATHSRLHRICWRCEEQPRPQCVLRDRAVKYHPMFQINLLIRKSTRMAAGGETSYFCRRAPPRAAAALHRRLP